MASSHWNKIKPIVDAVVFSNTWISLGTLSLYLSVKLVFHLPIVTYEAVLVFAASFLAYNFLKLKGLSHEGNTSIFNLWMKRNKGIIYVLMFIASLALIYSFGRLTVAQFLVLASSGLLSLIYVGFERYNLRSFWFLKTQIVAFVWAIFIIGVALVEQRVAISLLNLCLLFGGVFFFILGLTIPFDVRDWKADRLNPKLTTLPMVFGLKGTLVIAILHLFLGLICLVIFSPSALGLAPLFVLGSLLIYRLNADSSEYYYTFALDGLIVLVYPILYIGSLLVSTSTA